MEGLEQNFTEIKLDNNDKLIDDVNQQMERNWVEKHCSSNQNDHYFLTYRYYKIASGECVISYGKHDQNSPYACCICSEEQWTFNEETYQNERNDVHSVIWNNQELLKSHDLKQIQRFYFKKLIVKNQ